MKRINMGLPPGSICVIGFFSLVTYKQADRVKSVACLAIWYYVCLFCLFGFVGVFICLFVLFDCLFLSID